jgi:hypothetical protein
MTVLIEDVVNGQTSRLEDLLRLFIDMFPQYAAVTERIKIKANLPVDSNPNFIAHQWLVDVDGNPAALNSFKFSLTRGLGLTVFIAIRPEYRSLVIDGHRFSEWLIQTSIKQIQMDAQNCGQQLPSGLCLEVEPAHLAAHYRTFGFIDFPLEYYEPLFVKARQGFASSELHDMHFERRYLGYFPASNLGKQSITPQLLTRVIMMYYKDHYGINEEHPIFQKLLLQSAL